MNLKQNLGKKIKKYRLLKGISQEKFAEKLNISQQTLSKIECGKNFLTSETLEKIPSILGVNIHELFMFDENEYSAQNMINDIENYLELVKNNPKKLVCIHRLIKEIALL